MKFRTHAAAIRFLARVRRQRRHPDERRYVSNSPGSIKRARSMLYWTAPSDPLAARARIRARAMRGGVR